MLWDKINQFTGEPYKRVPGRWVVVGYVSGEWLIRTRADGDRELLKNGELVRVFQSLKAAKAFAEKQ